jgi:capsular polysaccharide biosynthesis protein
VRRVLRVARRVAKGATSRLKALVPERPLAPGLPLTIVSEAAVLPRVANVLDGGVPAAPGVVAEVTPESVEAEAETRLRLTGRVGGVDAPAWAAGAGGVRRASVDHVRVPSVWHAPAFGAVFNDQGQVFQKTVQEALYLTPALGLLPGVRVEGDQVVFRAPSKVPQLERATIFMAWGGLHSYGHFLIECLPALVAAIETDATRRFPAIAPPLLPWHRDLLALLLGSAPPPRVIEAPLARIEDAIYASTLDHFLHAPNAPLDRVRERILATSAVDPTIGPRRIYVSRRDSADRVLINELDLETALAARGFAIVRPATLSVREQVALFHGADVVVAATGAAMANILFCRPGTKVVELQPANFTAAWSRDLALFSGLDWRAFFAPSPFSQVEMMLEEWPRPDAAFSWRLDLPAFLGFLDVEL